MRLALALSFIVAGCGSPMSTLLGLGAPCNQSSDCPNTETCFLDVPGGECSQLCQEDKNCGAGNACVMGRCQPGCVTGADCPAGMVCVGAMPMHCEPSSGDLAATPDAASPADLSRSRDAEAEVDAVVAQDLGAPIDQGVPHDAAMPGDLASAIDAARPADLAHSPDLLMRDSSAQSDLARLPDLAVPDLKSPQDLAVPDLKFPPDLSMPDLAPPPDLSMSDLSPPPDLAMPDLKSPPDLEMPDLKSPPDLTMVANFCHDLMRNGKETDVDCGGGGCGPCGLGAKCAVAGDCKSMTCNLGHCVAAHVLALAFGAPKQFAAGIEPVFFAAADLNHDGKTDLVVGTNNSTLEVILGNGDGTLAAPVPYAAKTNDVMLTDLNGDGFVDVVQTVQVFLGKGDGTLSAPVDFAGCGRVEVAADFNRDGRTDVASLQPAQGNNHLCFFAGPGDGTLGAPSVSQLMPVGTYLSVATADLNGDAKLDLVIDCEGFPACDGAAKVMVVLGNGDGTFQPAIASAQLGGGVHFSLAVDDFNGDGKVDVAVPNAIALGTGDGHLGTFASLGVDARVIVAADFDGDGKVDLATVEPMSQTLRILKGKGDGTFEAPMTIATPGLGVCLIVADLNGDGLPDLVTADDNNTVTVFLNSSK